MALSRFGRRMACCAGLVGVVGAAFCGCGGGGGSSSVSNNGGSGGVTFVAPGTSPFVNPPLSSRAACQANTHQNGRARWTILVYMNAASNLQPDSLINIAQ